MTAASGWNEALGNGIRRDHRVACASSKDRKPGRRCGCPYSFWIPDPSKRSAQRRARVEGELSPSAALHEKEKLVVEARERIAAQQDVAPVVEEKPMLREWARRCFKVTWRDLSPKTLQTREIDYRLRIDPHLGHLRLDEVTPLVVEGWLNELRDAEGEVTRAIEKAAECLRTMCSVAVKSEVIDRNPVKTIPRADRNSERRRGRRVLSREQYDQLVTSCDDPWELALVRVATEACLRQGELCALRWCDVDFAARRLHVTRTLVQTKAGGRVVKERKMGTEAHPAISPSLAALLAQLHFEAMVEKGAAPEDPVWTGRGARGKAFDRTAMLSPSSVGSLVARLIEQAGLVDDRGKRLASLHDLRRTGASLLASAGAPESVVQDQLGHARGSRITFEHYIEQPDDAQRDQWVAGF